MRFLQIWMAGLLMAGASIGNSAVVYNSLAAANGQDGFIWGGGFIGDAITLSGTSAVLESLTFQAAPLTAGNHNFMVSFYDLDPGADSTFQTGDDKIGGLLGNSTVQSSYLGTPFSLSTVTLTGFSISVPKNFLWVVANFSSDIMSATIDANSYSSVIGGTSSVSTGLWYNSGSPSPGSDLEFLGTAGTHSYGYDWAVQLNGVVSGVPEPSVIPLLGVGLAGLVLMRRVRREV